MAVRFPYRGWLFDLDGTIYVGERLVPGAAEVVAALRAEGRRVAFLSNKPLETRADYARKLTRLGIPVRRRRRDQLPPWCWPGTSGGLDPGAPVYVIGEPPLLAEMRAHGFEVRDDERVRWVVIAFDRTFTYAKLNTALQAVKGGARLIATNPDRTCPVEGGEIPDCAGMIAAVEAVTDRKVETIVGKPSPIILEVALAALGVAAARRRHGGRPHRDRRGDGQAERARHHSRAERDHAARRPANRRPRSRPRDTIRARYSVVSTS